MLELKTKLSDSVCSWSTSSSHPALIPNQSGTCGPQLKVDKQKFAPVVALCPASCYSLSSVFTRHLSITCNLPSLHARLQNQLVCVTLSLSVSTQLSKLSPLRKNNNNNNNKSLQVRRGNGVWWLSSERYFLSNLSSQIKIAPEDVPPRMRQRAQSLPEFNWEGEQTLNDPWEAVNFLQHHSPDVICMWKSVLFSDGLFGAAAFAKRW